MVLYQDPGEYTLLLKNALGVYGVDSTGCFTASILAVLCVFVANCSHRYFSVEATEQECAALAQRLSCERITGLKADLRVVRGAHSDARRIKIKVGGLFVRVRRWRTNGVCVRFEEVGGRAHGGVDVVYGVGRARSPNFEEWHIPACLIFVLLDSPVRHVCTAPFVLALLVPCGTSTTRLSSDFVCLYCHIYFRSACEPHARLHPVLIHSWYQAICVSTISLICMSDKLVLPSDPPPVFLSCHVLVFTLIYRTPFALTSLLLCRGVLLARSPKTVPRLWSLSSFRLNESSTR